MGSLLLRGQAALSLSVLAHCLDVPDLVGGWESEWGGAGGGAGSQVWARVWGEMVCEGWLAASAKDRPPNGANLRKALGGFQLHCCHLLSPHQ